MAVRIRLARVGKKKFPFYRLVAVDSRSKRDGQALDILATYNPRNKQFDAFHDERIQEWVSKGALLTDSAKRLCKLYRDEAAKEAVASKAKPKKTEKKAEAKKTVKAKEVEETATEDAEVKAEEKTAKAAEEKTSAAKKVAAQEKAQEADAPSSDD